jgi:predicted dinucleotide-binding enzyme
MARGIGLRAVAAGHEVGVMARDAAKGASLAAELQKAAKPGASAKYLPLAAASVQGEIVVLAVQYAAAAEVVAKLKPGLEGKVLVDITNPLNASYDGLVTPAGSSAAEEIAKLAGSGVRVVKGFNTAFASSLAEGKVAGQSFDIFLAGDDKKAKDLVAGLLGPGGPRALDIGPLKLSRQLEQFGLLSIMAQGALGTGFKSAWKLLAP